MDINSKFIKDVGKRIRFLRKRNKWTINDLLDKLADEFNVFIDEKTIRRYEYGEVLPKTENLIMLAKIFNVSLDYLIFDKESTDDNSYTYEDNFKRLNRLIYSMMLIPEKVTDQDSKYYGKYYFESYDEEVSVYLDRIVSLSSDKNYTFEVLNKKMDLSIKDFDEKIGDFREDKTDLSPSKARVINILTKAGINPEEFLLDHLEKIEKRRRK